MGGMADSAAVGRIARVDADPWRRGMRRAAERLRNLDAERFKAQIEQIEASVRTDAEWNLAAALRSAERWRATAAR